MELVCTYKLPNVRVPHTFGSPRIGNVGFYSWVSLSAARHPEAPPSRALPLTVNPTARTTPSSATRIGATLWSICHQRLRASTTLRCGRRPIHNAQLAHAGPRLQREWYQPTQYFNGTVVQCDGSGEDPACADQWSVLRWSVSAHTHYFNLTLGEDACVSPPPHGAVYEA